MAQEEDEFEEEEDFVEDDQEIEEAEIEKEQEAPPQAPKVEPAPSKTLSSPEEITLPVIVEAGRIQLSVKTLMELTPGNILDLDLHPEQGVDLVVNGNKVARGELLQIGDMVGVRILEKC